MVVGVLDRCIVLLIRDPADVRLVSNKVTVPLKVKMVSVRSYTALLKKSQLSMEISVCLYMLTFAWKSWNRVMPCLPNRRGWVGGGLLQSRLRLSASQQFLWILFAPHARLPIWEGLGPLECEHLGCLIHRGEVGLWGCFVYVCMCSGCVTTRRA